MFEKDDIPPYLATRVRGTGVRYHSRAYFGYDSEFWKTFEDGDWKWKSSERYVPRNLCCAHYLARSARGARAEARAYGISAPARALLEVRLNLENMLDLRSEANIIYVARQVLEDIPNHVVHLLRMLVYPAKGGNALCDEIGYWAMTHGFAGVLYFNARAIDRHRDSFSGTGDAQWGINVSRNVFRTLRKDLSCQNLAVLSGLNLVRSISSYRFDRGQWTENVWYNSDPEELDKVVRYGSEHRRRWMEDAFELSTRGKLRVSWDGNVRKEPREQDRSEGGAAWPDRELGLDGYAAQQAHEVDERRWAGWLRARSSCSLLDVRREPMKQEHRSGFEDPTGLTKWTKWSLYAQVVISVIALISGAFEYQLLNDFKSGVYTSQPQAVAAGEASDARQRTVGVIQFVTFVVSGILILKWIHRANFNARQLGASDMQFTPGWSVGWYFIPVANLWKPYRAMKEIWKASVSPEDWHARSVPSILPWWWFFWIVFNMFANASFRLTMRAKEIDELIAANIVTLISDVAAIPLSLIVLAMVKRVCEMQTAHYARHI